MRFLYGFIAIALWAGLVHEIGIEMSEETAALTCAIVAAGAMAGGA